MPFNLHTLDVVTFELLLPCEVMGMDNFRFRFVYDMPSGVQEPRGDEHILIR